jgi:hypothetical protein
LKKSLDLHQLDHVVARQGVSERPAGGSDDGVLYFLRRIEELIGADGGRAVRPDQEQPEPIVDGFEDDFVYVGVSKAVANHHEPRISHVQPPAKLVEVRFQQGMFGDIDAQLAELKVSPDEIAKIQIPFVKMVRVDFLFLFQGVLNQYATILNSKLVEDVHQAKDPSAATGLMMRHSDLITAWTKRARNDDPAGALEKQSLEDLLNDFIPKSGEWLSDKELAVVQKFKAEIVRLNADCEKRGGYTTEASTYYDRYSGEHNIDKAKQLRNEVLQ